MERDINKLRDFETGGEYREEYDIVRKKRKIKQIFENDPDIKEILGVKKKKPLNQYKVENHPTSEEISVRDSINHYNLSIEHKQVVEWIKLNGIQKEVLNFIMFDIKDRGVSYTNKVIKDQVLEVWCLVHENDMDTEYDIPRVDILSYLVKDLLNWSNVLGMQLKCIADTYDIVDSKYYGRRILFQMEAPNGVRSNGNNRYDRFSF